MGSRADVRLAESVRRLQVRYEKRADIHEAFLSLAYALLCWNVLERHWHMATGRITVRSY
jgi:hypothetical protein